MSPIVEGKVILDKDGFLRDERGQKSMPHLTALIAALTGVCLLVLSSWGYVTAHEGWVTLLNVGGGLVGAAAGLEGYQSTIESRNQRRIEQ